MASLTGAVTGTRVVAHSDGTFSVHDNLPLSGATVTAAITGGSYKQTTTTLGPTTEQLTQFGIPPLRRRPARHKTDPLPALEVQAKKGAE